MDGNVTKEIEQYRATVSEYWMIAFILTCLSNIDAINDLQQRSESLGPVQFPSIWKQNAAQIAEDRELTKALKDCRDRLLRSFPNLRDMAKIAPALVNNAASDARSLLRSFQNQRSSTPVAPLAVAIIRVLSTAAVGALNENISVYRDRRP